jgi:hypothetical protein
VLAAVLDRAAPLTAAGEGAGREQESCRRRQCCAALWVGRKTLKILGLSRFVPPYIHHRFRRVRSRPSIWRSTAEIHRRLRGLETAQAGCGAGPLRRPSRWLLGLEPTRARVRDRGPVFAAGPKTADCEQLRFTFKF